MIKCPEMCGCVSAEGMTEHCSVLE